MRDRGELDSDQGTCLNPIKCTDCWPDSRPKEEEAMSFGHNQVCCQQRNSPRDYLAEHEIGLGMVLIAGAEEGNPGAAIDEEAVWNGALFCGVTAPSGQ